LPEPIRKNTTPVMTIDSPKLEGALTTNGSSGTRPHSMKAAKVLAAALSGERTALGRPYSSDSIVSTQRLVSAVITSTARSRSGPSKPLPRKICRISSRSPSGTASMWRSSTLRRCAFSSRSVLVPEKLPAAIENPSATTLARPRISTTRFERSAPTTPATIAKVVTAPSMPP
jgi:hypothetical protein